MRAVISRILIIVLLFGALLHPLKGVAFANSAQPASAITLLAAVDQDMISPRTAPADDFVLVPASVPCLMAITASSVHHAAPAGLRVLPFPAPAGQLTGLDVDPALGPPISC